MLCVSFFWWDTGLCIYHLVEWWKLNFLHNSQGVTFPTQSCLVLLLLFLLSFHISVSWWSFTGVWVTASLLRSPGLFWVFWQIAAVQYSGWFQSFLWFPNYPNPFPILLGPFQVHQLQLLSLWLSYSITFSVLWQSPGICPFFHFLSASPCDLLELQNPPVDPFFPFCLLTLGLVFLLG